MITWPPQCVSVIVSVFRLIETGKSYYYSYKKTHQLKMKNEALLSSSVRRNPRLVCLNTTINYLTSLQSRDPMWLPVDWNQCVSRAYVPFEEVKGEIFIAFPLSSTYGFIHLQSNIGISTFSTVFPLIVSSAFYVIRWPFDYFISN